MSSKEIKNFEKELRDLMEKPLPPELFPYTEDGMIFVGKYIIYLQNYQYHVRSLDSLFVIGKTFTRHGALSLIKSDMRRMSNKDRILHYDRILFNYRNNMTFYENVIKKSDDEYYKDVMKLRISNEYNEMKVAKRKLTNLIIN